MKNPRGKHSRFQPEQSVIVGIAPPAPVLRLEDLIHEQIPFDIGLSVFSRSAHHPELNCTLYAYASTCSTVRPARPAPALRARGVGHQGVCDQGKRRIVPGGYVPFAPLPPLRTMLTSGGVASSIAFRTCFL